MLPVRAQFGATLGAILGAILPPPLSDAAHPSSLQVTLPRAQVLELLKDAEEMKEVEIDLESQKVIREDGTSYPFEIDPFRKNCLLHGLDDIGLTMQKMDSIRAFEAARSERYPWLDGATTRVPRLFAAGHAEHDAEPLARDADARRVARRGAPAAGGAEGGAQAGQQQQQAQ